MPKVNNKKLQFNVIEVSHVPFSGKTIHFVRQSLFLNICLVFQKISKVGVLRRFFATSKKPRILML